jgi:tmRNA-binding protein
MEKRMKMHDRCVYLVYLTIADDEEARIAHFLRRARRIVAQVTQLDRLTGAIAAKDLTAVSADITRSMKKAADE